MEVTAHKAIDAVVIIIALLFIANYFPANLMLSNTVTAGGDTATHYYAAYFLYYHLLPNFQIFGWSPGWYGGFPMLQFYFPLPFLLMALIAPAVGLPVAFKLISVLGTFLLPLGIYYFLSKLKFPFPTPAIGAALSIPYLFYEANSIWGGNIPSTLAGEFAYSLSIPLLLIFLGMLYDNVKNNQFSIATPIVLASVILSHLVTTFVGVCAAAYFLFDVSKLRKSIPLLFITYTAGFMLAAFWLLPAALHQGWTTSYADYWPIDTASFYTATVIGSYILGFIGLVLGARKRDDRIFFLFFCFIVSLALMAFAPKFTNTLNIRFWPFQWLFALLLSAFALGELVNMIPKISFAPDLFTDLSPLIIIAILAGYTFLTVAYIPAWVTWNYSGFEGKASWPEFEQMNTFISNLPGDARVTFEHSGDYNEFGTERAFEMLPYFTGKNTIEGLYMQSTPSSPFIFYSQCQYSPACSEPIPRINYPGFDINAGTAHLLLWNVEYLIQDTAQLKTALDNDSDWKQIAQFGRYGIYQLLTNNGNYVVPVPQVVQAPLANWENVSLAWYASLDNRTIVFSNGPVPQSAPYNGTCVTDENITDEQISFDTNCIGTAHLIKISYYPNWVPVTGANQVYLASPSMMLVYPTAHHVVIQYERSWDEYVGILLTLIAAAGLAGTYFLWKRTLKKKDKSLKKR